MPLSGLAILIGAGPTTGSGIARILASPTYGNMAVALLSRTADPNLPKQISKTCYGGEGILKEFQTDTSEPSLTATFDKIRTWTKSLEDGENLKLAMAVYNVKHSHKVAFEEETAARYADSLNVYATGAMVFSQLAIKWMLGQYPPSQSSSGSSGGGGGGPPSSSLQKKGTVIFTSTLGALRTNPQFAAYGGTRAAVRMLAQSLAREFSARGVHVVHAIANGGITDKVAEFNQGEKGGENEEDLGKVQRGERMKAESVGKLYLSCALQDVDLWVHELDMRPAAEKF